MIPSVGGGADLGATPPQQQPSVFTPSVFTPPAMTPEATTASPWDDYYNNMTPASALSAYSETQSQDQQPQQQQNQEAAQPKPMRPSWMD